MATKKKATKKKSKQFTATNLAVLKFNPKWFTDPAPPEWSAAIKRQIARLKTDFASQFNQIVKKG